MEPRLIDAEISEWAMRGIMFKMPSMEPRLIDAEIPDTINLSRLATVSFNGAASHRRGDLDEDSKMSSCRGFPSMEPRLIDAEIAYPFFISASHFSAFNGAASHRRGDLDDFRTAESLLRARLQWSRVSSTRRSYP